MEVVFFNEQDGIEYEETSVMYNSSAEHQVEEYNLLHKFAYTETLQ